MKRRLLVVTDDHEAGGTYRLAERLAMGLSGDFSVHFGCNVAGLPDSSRSVLEGAGVSIHPCRVMPFQFLHATFSTGYGLELLRESRPDLILFVDSHCIWSLLALKRAAKERSIPFVTVINSMPQEYLKLFRSAGNVGSAITNIGIVSADSAARLVLVSTAALRVLEDEFPTLQAPRHVIVNGCAPARFVMAGAQARQDVRSLHGLDETDVAFICVARICALKGQRLCLEAVKKLRDENRLARVRLLFAGGGPQAEVDALRQAVADAALESRITVLGHCEDVTSLLGACDGFALASHTESMPFSVIEAMAQGLPVIATDVGGMSELLGDGAGMLVPSPEKSEAACIAALADAMSALATDSGRRSRHGHLGRERALSRFHEDRMIAQYREIITCL